MRATRTASARVHNVSAAAAAIEIALVVVAHRTAERLCDCAAACAPQDLETVAAAAFEVAERLDSARAVYTRVIEHFFRCWFFLRANKRAPLRSAH